MLLILKGNDIVIEFVFFVHWESKKKYFLFYLVQILVQFWIPV